MPGTIASDQTVINAAEATTNWLTVGTWGANPAANGDIFLEGANALNARASAAAGPVERTAWSLAATSAGLDLTASGRHVYFWIKCFSLPAMNTRAKGGIRLSISEDVTPTLTGTDPWSGPTNSKSWFLTGSDFEPTSGWVCYVVDPTSTPDLLLGTAPMTGVDRAGVGTDALQVVGGGAVKPNPVIWDKIGYQTKLTITLGTSGSPVTMVDIFAADSANANQYGIVGRSAGIYLLAGKLIFGTTGQSAVTTFTDSGQVFVWQDFPVATGFYEIQLVGAASFATTVQLGSFSGGLTSNGVTIKGTGKTTRRLIAPVIVSGGTGYTAGDILTVSGGTGTAATFKVITVSGGVITAIRMETSGSYSVPPTGTLSVTGGTGSSATFTATVVGGSVWTLTASASNQTLKLYACTLSDMVSAALASTSELRGCTLLSSGAVTANGALIDNCTFQDLATSTPISATWALIVNSSSEVNSKITNCKFINCNNAIKITAAGTYTFDNLTFSGNTFDIENSSAGLVTINATNGANPVTHTETGGGSTVINNAKTIKVTVKDITGTAIENVRVSVRKVSDNSAILDDVTNASGIVSGTFNYAVDIAVKVVVREASTPTPKYFPVTSPQTITVTGLDTSITLIEDPIIT